MEVAKMSTKGQLVVPEDIRKKLGLRRGSKVVVIEEENGFRVKLLNKKYFMEIAGILGTKGDMLKSLLREKKLERRREDGKFG